MSQEVYWEAVRCGKEIDWQCAVCSHPDSYADPSGYLESGALMRRERELRTPKNPSLMWRTSRALIRKNPPFMTPLQLRRRLPSP